MNTSSLTDIEIQLFQKIHDEFIPKRKKKHFKASMLKERKNIKCRNLYLIKL